MILTITHNLARLLSLAFEPPVTPSSGVSDRWTGRRLTIIALDGAKLTVRDERDAVVTLPLSYGLEQALANAMRDTGRTDPAGFVLLREPFDVDGLPFWQWAVLPHPFEL
ncbi:hypothetical protein [Chelatococcus asaccharovorans]|uniref:hypothetical protein n=1 Tax=Chelatococcus asaccharovorans TaxID=28210 RepID=UPI00224C7373|nr:hypothetical protein [Chelatococcus asaccharovorans]CAH1649194.1 conserved hypothetical protein [Chelatococcus asaccharovorans]CAH1687124.1 conserved hypothetical protein [Chelatococcus asaccharovorans]